MDLSRGQNGELKGVSELKRHKEEGSSQCSDLTMQASLTCCLALLALSSLRSHLTLLGCHSSGCLLIFDLSYMSFAVERDLCSYT